jgi:sugar lactone lactonase YvrE
MLRVIRKIGWPMRKILSILLIVPFFASAQVVEISTVCGDGLSGYTGDGGPALSAEIGGGVEGLAFDNLGNYYFTIFPNRVRKVSVYGEISTFAGTSVTGFGGDSSLATSAELNDPTYIAVDYQGNVYFSDAVNCRIRKVDVITGKISTIAGTGIAGYNGDGIAATSAQLKYPLGICFDSAGNLYVADQDNFRIRKIDTSGIITTVAGHGVNGYSGDGGVPTAAAMLPTILCFDRSGNLVFADGSELRKVDFAANKVIRIAGDSSIEGDSGDEGPASAAILQSTGGLALSKSGEIYLSDASGESYIRMIDTSGIIHHIAGNGTESYTGDNIPADTAGLSEPRGIAFDPCGNLYIADNGNYRIRKITYALRDTATISLGTPDTAASGDSTVVNASLTNAGSIYKIIWYKNGLPFDTTATPSLTYANPTKGNDTITATVIPQYLQCTDSSSSNVVVAKGKNVGIGSILSGGGIAAVYPNPAKDMLHIEGTAIDDITLTNLVGQEVYSHRYTAVQKATITLTGLPSGIYFVRVNGVYVAKVVRE